MNPAASVFSFIHAADIHLDSPLRGLERYEGAPVEALRSATRAAFSNLIELAIERSVDFVLLAGDLYDGDWKDYSTGLFLVRSLARLGEHGIAVVIVAGNHDAQSQITRHLQMPANVHVLASSQPQSIELVECGVLVHGQSFATREVQEDLTQAYPLGRQGWFNIGLLHTSLDGKPGHAPYAPCKLDNLRNKGYQYWALGHVHQREYVSEDPWVVFPGNLQGRHIREIGPKGCVLVSVEQGEVRHVNFQPVDVMRWELLTIDISDCSNAETLLNRIQQNFKALIENADGRWLAVRLRLLGRTPLHTRLQAETVHWLEEFRALANAAGEEAIWLEKVLFDTQPVLSDEELAQRADALGELLQVVEALEQDAAQLHNYAHDFSTLQRKLPAEFWIEESEALGVEAGQQESFALAQILPEVKAMLQQRLIQAQDED